MGSNATAFRYFHLREAGAAASAPRHNVVPAVDETLVVALLEKSPNRVVVFVGESEVAAAVFGRTELANNFAGARGLDATTGEFHGDDSISISQRVAQSDQYLRIVPITPISQPDGLLGLPRGE